MVVRRVDAAHDDSLPADPHRLIAVPPVAQDRRERKTTTLHQLRRPEPAREEQAGREGGAQERRRFEAGGRERYGVWKTPAFAMQRVGVAVGNTQRLARGGQRE